MAIYNVNDIVRLHDGRLVMIVYIAASNHYRVINMDHSQPYVISWADIDSREPRTHAGELRGIKGNPWKHLRSDLKAVDVNKKMNGLMEQLKNEMASYNGTDSAYCAAMALIDEIRNTEELFNALSWKEQRQSQRELAKELLKK